MLALRGPIFAFSPLLAILALAAPSPAQSTASRAPYTLHKHVREVLTDVTVTGANGEPVTGLPRSAFHVYDNGNPQTIEAFTAHSGQDRSVLPASTQPGTYSNRYLNHPPAVYDVLLIDVTSARVTDQMVLTQQLLHLVKQLPPHIPLAIYAHTGPHVVLMQNFTTSKASLAAAITRTIPRIPDAAYQQYSDAEEINQIAGDLSQYPGRKNLLWFTNGFNLRLFPGSASRRDYDYLQPLYDTLQKERIALYPIDLRGLTVERGEIQSVPVGALKANTHPSQGLQKTLALAGTYVQNLPSEHILMDGAAQATGGHAYYGTNGLAMRARQIIDRSADFYTLSYSPNDLQQNNHWHNVRITVAGNYHLTYRHGYYDDDSQSAPPHQPMTIAHNTDIQRPDFHSDPIIFQAQVHSASPAERAAAKPQIPHSERAYTVRYILPAQDFPQGKVNSAITLSTAAVVIDDGGVIVGKRFQILQLKLNQAQLRANPHGDFAIAQTIAAPRGRNHLYLAVWDTSTGRLGTLQIPIDVKEHADRR